jgi:hypothetical protein
MTVRRLPCRTTWLVVLGVLVGLVIMHVGLGVVGCHQTGHEPSAFVTVTVHHPTGQAMPAPAAKTCDRGMAEVCLMVLTSLSQASLILLMIAAALCWQLSAGRPRAPGRGFTGRRRRPGPPGPLLSALCVFRV